MTSPADLPDRDPRAGVLVTGANGHLGLQLLEHWLGSDARSFAPAEITAAVRSERAASLLGARFGGKLRVAVVDPLDSDALARAASHCDAAVHLIGIIREGGGNRYVDAHERSCEALVRAAARVGLHRIVYLSSIGSAPDAANACYASRHRAERILLDSVTPTTILRLPMVIGEADYASASLRAQAQRRVIALVDGGESLEQPIDARDVIAAIDRALAPSGFDDHLLELAGSESLPRYELVMRAAALYGNAPRIVSIPRELATAAAAALEKLSSNPPLTRAMLEVLEHDDDIDPRPALEVLSLRLTPLAETLLRYVGPGSEPRSGASSQPGNPEGTPAPSATPAQARTGTSEPSAKRKRSAGLASRLAVWGLTLLCFAYLFAKIDAQAAREGQNALPYLAGIFENVNWAAWLALMIPYSALFFLVDSLVVWRVINWFDARVPYRDILPIRASAYILSILNEQVGKGAMALYLNRRDGVPGWQVGSSMLFIMFCEFFYLLTWATLGVALAWDELPAAFHALPEIALGAALVLALWVAYFRGAIAPSSKLRERPILHAFRNAHLANYLGVIALRSPALLAAVVVYTFALRLFGVSAEFAQMLGYLPVIFFGAAVPGPFRAVAITLWTVLFPENPGQMAAFGLVQHNFFIFFNAAIGLCFLRRANRELLG
jgi:uncharacterized protein YbjT (DUF2867 family)